MKEDKNLDCMKEEYESDYKNGWFTGLLPAWINAPSTLQPAHRYHGRNVVAIHKKGGGFVCSLIDTNIANTFNLPENTNLVSGWRIKSQHLSSDYAWAVYNFIWDYKNGKFGEEMTLQQAIDKYFKYEEVL